jgi:hypothetical protein
MNGGQSAPEGQTICRSISLASIGAGHFVQGVGDQRRNVRALVADSPPVKIAGEQSC